MPIAVFAGRLPARMAHGRSTGRRSSRLIQTLRPSPKPCSIRPIRAAVARWQSVRPTARPATCTRCTNGDPQIPIAPAEPGAPRPATPFPGGFRTPALGASGGVRAGPPSETRHKSEPETAEPVTLGHARIAAGNLTTFAKFWIVAVACMGVDVAHRCELAILDQSARRREAYGQRRGGFVHRNFSALTPLAVAIGRNVMMAAQAAHARLRPAVAPSRRLAGTVEHRRDRFVRHPAARERA